MRIEFVPLLTAQREIYSIPRGKERFRNYLRTLVDDTGVDVEFPPLVAINPMARDHVPTLIDALIALDADAIAAQALAEAKADLAEHAGKSANRPLTDGGPRVDRGQRGAAAGEYQMVWLADPDKGTFTKFEHSDIEQIADKVMAGVPVQDRVWLTEYDNYYRSRENIRPLPVLRVRYLDEQSTWLYFDPHRGTITPHQRLSRMNRWLYAGLHEFDLPFLYNSRPLWDIVVILLSIGGILLSGTTLWPMVKRLARHGRRVMMVFRPARARESERVSAD